MISLMGLSWICLIISGCGEILGVWGLKMYAEKKRMRHLLLVIGYFSISLCLLTIALQSIKTSVAYAIWSGFGAVGGTIMGILVFNDSKDRKRLFFITLIVVGVVGLRITS